MTTTMAIEQVPIGELRPDPANPRRISDAELESLTRSIQQFGFVSPVLARRDDKVVIGGHQRLVAARKIGMKTVPVIYVDLTPEKAKLLNIALNKISGSWDQELLARLLAELNEAPDVDLALSGFSDDEVKKLLKTLDTREKRERPESFDLEVALEAATTAPQARRGDLFLLGDHRIACGDAADAADVARLLDGRRAAICFIDPPYNVDLGNHGGAQRGQRKRTIANDAVAPEQWEAFCRAWAGNLLASVDGILYICMSTKEWPTVSRILGEQGAHWSDTIIWAKDRFVLGRPTTSGSTSRSGTAGGREGNTTGAATGTRGTSGPSSGHRPTTSIPP